MSGQIAPLNVFSNQEAERILGINFKQKKEDSDDIMCTKLEFPPMVEEIREKRENTVLMVRQSILKAITAPYLRGVVAFFISPEKTVMQIAQVRQKPITKFELMGVIIKCYEAFQKHKSPKVIVGFKERKETHMISGSEFSDFLTEELNDTENAEVLLINVHHDYLDAYTNIGNIDSILELLIEIEGNSSSIFG